MSQKHPTPEELQAYAGNYILNGGNQSDAWRSAFPKSTALEKNIHNMASKFHALPEVQDKIEAMRSDHKEIDDRLFDISIADNLSTLNEVMKAGLNPKEGEKPNLSAVVSAVSEVNKMKGYYAPKAVDLQSSDGSMSPVKSFNDMYEE